LSGTWRGIGVRHPIASLEEVNQRSSSTLSSSPMIRISCGILCRESIHDNQLTFENVRGNMPRVESAFELFTRREQFPSKLISFAFHCADLTCEAASIQEVVG